MWIRSLFISWSLVFFNMIKFDRCTQTRLFLTFFMYLKVSGIDKIFLSLGLVYRVRKIRDESANHEMDIWGFSIQNLLSLCRFCVSKFLRNIAIAPLTSMFGSDTIGSSTSPCNSASWFFVTFVANPKFSSDGWWPSTQNVHVILVLSNLLVSYNLDPKKMITYF